MAPRISLPFSRHSLTFSGLCFADGSVSKESQRLSFYSWFLVCKTDLTQVICYIIQHDILKYTNGLPKNPQNQCLWTSKLLRRPFPEGPIGPTSDHPKEALASFLLMFGNNLQSWIVPQNTTWTTGNKSNLQWLCLVWSWDFSFISGSPVFKDKTWATGMSTDCCTLVLTNKHKNTTYCKPNHWTLTRMSAATCMWTTPAVLCTRISRY